MARSRLFRCPYCSQTFFHDLSVSSEPELCPLCNNTGDAPAVLPTKLPEDFRGPHIATGTAKNVDDYWKATQEAAEHRALMAEANGMSREEANNIRITDMPDNLREGDIAERPAVNDVSKVIDANPGRTGMMSAQQLFAANPAIRSAAAEGPVPFAGLKTLGAVKQLHGGAGGIVTDEIPSLEIQARDNMLAKATGAGFRRR